MLATTLSTSPQRWSHLKYERENQRYSTLNDWSLNAKYCFSYCELAQIAKVWTARKFFKQTYRSLFILIAFKPSSCQKKRRHLKYERENQQDSTKNDCSQSRRFCFQYGVWSLIVREHKIRGTFINKTYQSHCLVVASVVLFSFWTWTARRRKARRTFENEVIDCLAIC